MDLPYLVERKPDLLALLLELVKGSEPGKRARGRASCKSRCYRGGGAGTA